MKKWIALTLIAICCNTYALPDGFVYLHDVDPSILQDMRYADYHNFVGRPIHGYEAHQCILTREAAEQLKKVQHELLQSNLSLKVYDCYRPQTAVNDFISWSKNHFHNPTKREFYPNVDKKDFFTLGYVAERSGHTRGSTVDLTIVHLPLQKERHYRPGQALIACTAPYHQRFFDNSIDMGTGFDCLDPQAHIDSKQVSTAATVQRHLLRALMMKYGFEPYEKEWWHFTLKNEPYPDQYFDFMVR